MKVQFAKSRTDVLAIILLLAMAIFVFRLFYLQIIKHNDYTQLAQRSQQRTFVIPAERGQIFMMDGDEVVPVVLNRTAFTVIADPQTVKDEQHSEIISELKKVAGGEMLADAETRLANKKSRYEVLARNITLAQAEKLKEKNFAGILYQRGTIRNYPEGRLAAQTLGFVNVDGKGQYGVEGGLNDRLKGRDGLMRAVTDVRNVPLMIGRDDINIKPQAGENIVLTIDRNIQSYAEEALQRGLDKAGATEGSVVVMNPNNGQVLAMANYPTFDPANYAKEKDASVFVNGAAMVPHEPGSVIKTFTVAAAVDKGVIGPQTSYYNTDCTKVGDRTICNATRGLIGSTTMQGVLNNSLNVGTVTIGRMLGDGSRINAGARQTIYEYFHDRFGFGQATGIEIPEVQGLVHGPNRGDGDEVRYANMTFGQGLNMTSVQAAAAFCSVVNGGQYFRPTLVAGVIDSDGKISQETPAAVRRTVSEQASATMRSMLDTARHSSWVGQGDPGGYMIGGKTGTSEALIDGSYTENETVGTYVGFGGTNKPEYVIMIKVAAPGKGISMEGGTHASPIFADISNWMIDYMKLPPRST